MDSRQLTFPKYLWSLLTLYCLASLLHFAHNAEYIGFYPNMPAWITRQTVYLAWLMETSVGILGSLLILLGWQLAGIVTLMLYGTTGFDGLGHYALALCSQHTLAQNFTIWFEVATGALLFLTAAHILIRYWRRPDMGY